MKFRIIIFSVLAALAVSIVVMWRVFLSNALEGDNGEAIVLVYPNQSEDDVRRTLSEASVRTTGFRLLSRLLKYHVRTGRYIVRRGDSIVTVFRRLRNGQQEAVRLTIPSVRTVERLAAYLDEHLMMDSLSAVEAFRDSIHLFLPNTYEVWWTVTTDDLMSRMQRESNRFWEGERDRKANALGLSRREVITLASIVNEETAYQPEMPMVAAMYLHRLEIGMPLQADPTVKFALGDFSLRRIWGKHLTVDSPYNTYRNTGLPPGPIRIPTVEAIDAVLSAPHTDYLYMCAREDFSGSHRFATTYSEHLRNARLYTQALNQRNIK